MKSIFFCFFPLLWGIALVEAKMPLKLQTRWSEQVKGIDSIYITNVANKRFGFWYNDKFGETQTVGILPGKKVPIPASEGYTLLSQTNENQNLYPLYPGENVIVSSDTNGNAIMTIPGNLQRTQELRLSVEMNRMIQNKFMVVLNFSHKYSDTDFKGVDSVFRYAYQEKIRFLRAYVQRVPISAGYNQFMESYFKSILYGSQLFLASRSKDKIPPEYLVYLDNLYPEIIEISNDKMSAANTMLGSTFAKYKSKKHAGTSSYPDSLYQQIRTLHLPKAVESRFLYLVINDMLAKDPLNTNPIINDFVHVSTDPELAASIVEKQSFHQQVKSAKIDFPVYTNEGNLLSFDEVTKSRAGRLIYIDFWASWCAPCRAEMNDSRRLQNLYKGKNIDFIFFSIDENPKLWKQAAIAERLTSKNSFLLPGFEKSPLTKRFSIKSIPRYILLGSDGNILDPNAPRPSDPKLEVLLKQYLD